MANKETNHKTFNCQNINKKSIIKERCLDRLGTYFVATEKRHEYENGSPLTVLDVLIRNSISESTKSTYGDLLCRCSKQIQASNVKKEGRTRVEVL